MKFRWLRHFRRPREGAPRDLRGGGLQVRESPEELSQGAPGRGDGELSGVVPGSSPWELGGGGLGAPGESQGELKMEPKWSQNGVSNGVSTWTPPGP